MQTKIAPRRLAKKPAHFPCAALLFFPAALLYHELLLHAFDVNIAFFGAPLLPICLFAIAGGLAAALLLQLPKGKAGRISAIVLMALWLIYTCIEYCCKSYFKSYFALDYVGTMTDQVLGDFFRPMLEVIWTRKWFILLSAVPLVLFIVFRKQILPDERSGKTTLLITFSVLVVCQLCGGLLCRGNSIYTYDFNTDSAVPQFGLCSTVRLEIEYALFGMPQPPLPSVPIEEDADTPQDKTEEPVVYGYNKMDIDFEALAEATGDNTLAAMHRYFGSLTPSRQNEYTGMFAGKNLILLTAEAFSPYVISEELTPTLYRLSHEGFVCSNFYQPGWGQSTTGGEFSVMTGLIPTWLGSNTSFWASRSDLMPFALGWQFGALGYNTPAWHDNTYDYYSRDKTHPNLGYDYRGIGNGLDIPGGGSDNWPCSDLDMMKATVSSYIDDYLATGTPFHAYYMTVSGHCNYGWAHAMSRKNRDAATAAYPNASTTVQAYIAANLELEYALSYLVEQLETAGIADDTVICMAADHYPYAMAQTDVDYYCELSGRNDTERDTSRYRSSLILWCGCMEEPVYVDIPCTAVDIVPTLSNLFGLTYDSRLLSGRDILAENYTPGLATSCMPLAYIPTTAGISWATAAGTYEASTGTFTPNPGISVSETYVDTVNQMVAAKYNYAKLTIQYDYYRILFGE